MNAGSDSNDGTPVGMSGVDIGRSVAKKADARIRAEPESNFGEGIGKDVRTLFVMIAEGAEGEVVAQAGGFNLHPADVFKIAGGEPEQLTAGVKMLNQLGDRRAKVRGEARS